MQADARGDRRLAETDREAQGMQMAGAGVVEARDVALARDPLRNFIALEESQLPVAVIVFLLALPFLQFVALPRLDTDVQMAPGEIAIDPVAFDEIPGQFDAFDTDVPESLRVGFADLRGELRHAAGVAGNQLAAGAAGSAETDALGFEQDDAITALGQMQGGRAARDTAADHADIGLDVARERGLRRRPARGRFVPACCGPLAHTDSRYPV